MGCTNQKSTSVKEYKKKLDNKEVSKIIDDIEVNKKDSFENKDTIHLVNSENKKNEKIQKEKLNNLKSNYILKTIFDIMKENKSLEIVKYNKKLQKKLNLSINDYKEYSQIRSSIEIEIKIADNKYGKFINRNIKKNNYYLIYFAYFDNSTKEIKSYYLRPDEKVKSIKIVINYQVKSFKGLFSECDCISSICFKKFYRVNIYDMSYMFYECKSLKELNLSNFNTNNVINMEYMFCGCSSLQELNLSNFNTSNVYNMNRMFFFCSSLNELNLSNFITNNVQDMTCMFNGCSSLKKLNIYNFNTNNVIKMLRMFSGCSSLNELIIANLNMDHAIYKDDDIFKECSKELKIKIKE